VASRDQNRLLEALSDRLKSSAVDLTSEGSAEFAFPVSCAREVYDSLVDAKWLILGGDLWKAENDGFSSCPKGWYIPSSDDDFSAARDEISREKWNSFIDAISDYTDFYVTFII